MKVQIAALPGYRVTLTFTNDGTSSEFLLPWRTFTHASGNPDRSCFEFDPAARHHGWMGSRAQLTDGQLIKVDPGCELVSDPILLTGDYDIPAGGPGRVRYKAAHPVHGLSAGLVYVSS